MLRLGTYNILIPRPEKEEKGHPWALRKAAVASTIVDNFDLVGLQEFSTDPEFNQSAELTMLLAAAGFSGYLPEFDSRLRYKDEFHQRLPIFWRTELFDLLDSGMLHLSSWDPTELALMPILEDRYCSFVKLLHKATGRTLWLYNLHLQHGLDRTEPERLIAHSKQEESLAEICAHLGSHAAEGETVAVVGDFNNPLPNDLCFKSAGLASAEALQQKINWSFNSFHNWSSPRPLQGIHIDHLYSRSGGFTAVEAEVILSQASDHYPVRMTLR